MAPIRRLRSWLDSARNMIVADSPKVLPEVPFGNDGDIIEVLPAGEILAILLDVLGVLLFELVGDAHVERIADALSSDLPEADVRTPAYNRLSLPHLKELVFPGIVSFSVLYVVYSGLLAYVQFVL